MRVLLFAGKGGVGRTTAAAATAVLAASSSRVLLVSTDPGRPLADVLGVPVGADPTPVGDLHAMQVDPRRRWPQVRSWLAELLGGPAPDVPPGGA